MRWVFVRGVVKGLSLSQPFPRAAACLFHLKMARAFATGVKMGLVPLPVACVVGGSQQGGLWAPVFISKMGRCHWLSKNILRFTGEWCARTALITDLIQFYYTSNWDMECCLRSVLPASCTYSGSIGKGADWHYICGILPHTFPVTGSG